MENEKVDEKRGVAQQQKIELLEKKLVTSVSECSRLASRVEELEKCLNRIRELFKSEFRMTWIEKQAMGEIESVLAGAHAEEKE